MVRQPYSVDVRFYADSEETTRITYYAVSPDTPTLPVATAFGNAWWSVDESQKRILAIPGFAGQGEQVGSPRPVNTRPYAGSALARAGHYCGTKEQWAGNLLLARDGTMPVDAFGTPLCCPRGEPAGAIDAEEGWDLMSGGVPAVFTKFGQKDKLDFQRPFATRLRFGLFTNDITPVYATDLTALTEATFAGYIRQPAKWTSPLWNPGGWWELQATSLSFRYDGGGLPETVYGWFAIDNTTGALVWASRLAIPVVVNVPGVVVRLAPFVLRLGNFVPAPPVLEYIQVALAGGGSTSQGVTARSSLSLALAGGGSGTSCVQAIAFGTEALAGGGSGTTWPYSISFAAEALAGGGSGTAIGLATAFTQAENAGGGAGTSDTQVRAFTQAGNAAGGSGTSCTQTYVPGTPFSIGFDFRATPGFVTDPTDCVPVLAQAYPHTFTSASGQSVTAGWGGGTEAAFDYSASFDPRLAGFNYSSFFGRYFQVDLPSAGSYRIALAIGGNDATNYADAQIQDTATPLLTVYNPGFPAGSFCDATGTAWLGSAWAGSNLPAVLVFGTLTLRVYFTASHYNYLVHVHLEKP